MNPLTDRENHYRGYARYYTNLSILKRVKASIHLENKDDKSFWEPMFRHSFPSDNFYFIFYSKNPYGKNTAGCTQCMAYRDFLNKNFIICIDSDYRHFFWEENIDITHLIFQTYTYSFENHLCIASGLSDVCKEICGLENDIYDFEAFFLSFSSIIFELFAWHIALCRINPAIFPIKEFWQLTNNQQDKDINNQSEQFLSDVKEKVGLKIKELIKLYPQIDVGKEKQQLKQMGITKKNTYLYVRGHNLYTLCSQLVKSVCRELLNRERLRLGNDLEKIQKLYERNKTFAEAIRTNIQFGQYPEIKKIEKDMKTYHSFF